MQDTEREKESESKQANEERENWESFCRRVVVCGAGRSAFSMSIYIHVHVFSNRAMVIAALTAVHIHTSRQQCRGENFVLWMRTATSNRPQTDISNCMEQYSWVLGCWMGCCHFLLAAAAAEKFQRLFDGTFYFEIAPKMVISCDLDAKYCFPKKYCDVSETEWFLLELFISSLFFLSYTKPYVHDFFANAHAPFKFKIIHKLLTLFAGERDTHEIEGGCFIATARFVLCAFHFSHFASFLLSYRMHKS